MDLEKIAEVAFLDELEKLSKDISFSQRHNIIEGPGGVDEFVEGYRKSHKGIKDPALDKVWHKTYNSRVKSL